MDKKHKNIHHCSKKEPYQQSSADHSLDWGSAESDTESLAQERAYQQQLQLNINNSSQQQETVYFKKNVDTSHEISEGSSNDDDEDLGVFDSLEMSNSHPMVPQGKDVAYQRNEKNRKSQVFPDDAYSHLHYGAGPETSSRAVGWSQEGPFISVDGSFVITEDTLSTNKNRLKKDGYMLVTDTSQHLMTPQNLHLDQPYLLHPQYGWNNAVSTPPPPQRSNVQQRLYEENCNHNTENKSAASELTEVHVRHNQNCTEIKTEHMDKSTKAQKTQEEDIVERNKLTLGLNTKYGSYAKAHALRGPQNGVKTQHAPKATSGSDIQSKIELPKTQQVKVSPRKKEKKAERKEDLTPAGALQPLAPGVRAGQGDSLSSTLTKAAVKRLKAPSSSQPLSPTIHLNINLNTTPHPPLLSTQQVPQSIIKLSYSDVSPELKIALSPDIQQTRHRNSSMTYQGGLHADLNQWNLDIPGQWQRLAALKRELLFEEESQSESLPEVQTLPALSTSPSSTAQSSSSYKVLPPIGQPGPEQPPELSPTQPGQRRVSDGYLVQMERKKLLKTQPTYKAYSLKDYRKLKPDVTLQGLGPDYSSIEKTKMRRQKLYSNLIREQNKTMSRMPCIPAKDPETNKNVPRIKALEYAKTIAKPPPPAQSKTKHKPEVNRTEHAPCVEGLDLSQLTTLELLRKRHEQEKQAVAMLRKIHAL